ncbi:hypothetical protein SAMN04488550_2906 [Gordonia malaquae]|uniref:Uncharacterized protein n=1 Tax=Gordonia malaquae NBRC 108250 TaxID=1223542 RepID=M3VAE6_GORML|nr:hypothetical protein [Gordonia malaquae]GAC78778.1 hypothetical protein GM1_004_02230 [Gordonia malaquae NBRC 108250]SED65657.1 hypothetical protein SAMN04488550_2906 [Gordonia malaquae]
MSTNQPITVNVQSGAGEVLRIVSTILLFGGAGAVAWSVAQGAHAELAATGMTLMIVMMVKLMYRRGLVRLPSSDGGDDGFAATKGMIAQVSGEYQRWLAGTSMPALAVISIGYAIAFLVLRAGVSAAFSVFQNLWVAGGVAAMIGAVVVFPSLLPSILGSLKRKGVVGAPVPPTVTATATVQPAPAPTATPAPTPAPQPTPAPAPAPAKRVVVRRVNKMENNNV